MDAINEILIYNTGLSASASKLMSTDSSNKTVLRVPIGEECEHEHEMMKSNFIKLSWKDVKAYTLPVGSLIKYGGVDWVLFDAYMPTANNDGYTYEPQFQHPEMVLGRTPLLLSTNLSDGTATKQTDWTITDTPSNIIAAIIKIIKAETNVTLTASYVQGDALKASGTCDFSATDILSALNTWASEFEAEWHIDWSTKKLYFGTVVSIGGTTTPSLVVGQNIGVPSVTDNTPEYRNYYIVRGSSKNISQTTASGENVQSDARLTLNLTDYPNSAIDKRKANEPKLVDILQFDDIYPHLDLYVYAPIELKKYRFDDNKQKVVAGYDDDNNPIYEVYSMWFVKLAYPTVSNGVTTWHAFTINPTTDLISGTTLTASFKANENGTSSKLAGREFEMSYLTTSTIYDSIDSPSVTIPSGYFYIKFVEENDIIIPMTSALGSLVPYGEGESLDDLNANNGADGYGNDMLTLYNLVMTGDYLASAQSELKNAADKEIAKRATNANNYSFDANACAGTLNLSVGQSVNYTDNGKTLATRVIKIVQKLDVPAQMNITVGNAIVKGNTQTLQEDVKSANTNITILQAINENAAVQLQATNRALKSIQEFSEMFEFDASGNIKTKYNLYSLKGISALGNSTTPGSGGGSSSGGVDMVSVWSALLANTNEQISLSHLTTALTNYYNKTEVNGLLSQLPKFAIKVVGALPTSDISATTIYLITDTDGEGTNLYKEYIYINNKWELIGAQKTNISNLIAKVDGSSDLLLASGSTITKANLLNGYLKNTDLADWAKASTKPTYTASEVGALPDTTDIPTKVGDLTDDVGIVTTGNAQTISGGKKFSGGVCISSLADSVAQSLAELIVSANKGGSWGTSVLRAVNTGSGSAIFGYNQGTGTGVFGYCADASAKAVYGETANGIGVSGYSANKYGVSASGGLADILATNGKILFVDKLLSNVNGKLQWGGVDLMTKGTSTDILLSNGTTLAQSSFLGATANASSATKLNNSRTLWGQSFNGTSDVSGNMSGVGSVATNGSTASGVYSLAFGMANTASATYASALGYLNNAAYANQLVGGRYNLNGNNAFEVGNGTSDSARSNAMSIDWSGNQTLKGGLTLNGEVKGVTNMTATDTIKTKTLYVGNCKIYYDEDNDVVMFESNIASKQGVSALGTNALTLPQNQIAGTSEIDTIVDDVCDNATTDDDNYVTSTKEIDDITKIIFG